MKDDQNRFLSLLSSPPARLTVEQTAWILNCQPHDIPVLVSERLLRPLGNPAPNAHKYFCTREILELSADRSWLAKLTNTLASHWRTKNEKKRSGLPSTGTSSVPLTAMS